MEERAINVIRGLAMDAVQKANSGHPGMPMGCAPMAVSLWTRHLKHNPLNPTWNNRDRFILSAGHGSMLLYSLLFATGYEVSMEDLKSFRQWCSITPGHPENTHTPGVEMATGPLGQGISTAVGMAMAEAHLASVLNKDGFPVVDHYTYVLASDGDLMEGVAQEACSLAGHLGLGKMIVLYDSNDITIDGSTSESFTEDTKGKFEALGWHCQRIDGMNPDQVSAAIVQAQKQKDKPSMIICRTVIGFGSPNKAGSSKSHGSPLGAEEIKLSKDFLGLPTDQDFYFPSEVEEFFRQAVANGVTAEASHQAMLEKYFVEYPDLKLVYQEIFGSRENLVLEMPSFTEPIATRNASNAAQNVLAAAYRGLFGGSADLTDNVMTRIKNQGLFSMNDRTARNVNFGIREHAMAAAANGITLSGGLGLSGTFLVFSDYCRPSVRLAALMEKPTIFAFSHDSIGLGEDGPTHQPIEHVMSLRLIPNLNVMRPCDGNETSVCWAIAGRSSKTPSALITSRQVLPPLSPNYSEEHPAFKGGYILRDAENPAIILVATGSEIQHAVAAFEMLASEGISARVVSMPSWFLFDQQPNEYKNCVLPSSIPKVSMEAGVTTGWHKYVDLAWGIDHYGASAPFQTLMTEFGFTPENFVVQAKKLM